MFQLELIAAVSWIDLAPLPWNNSTQLTFGISRKLKLWRRYILPKQKQSKYCSRIIIMQLLHLESHYLGCFICSYMPVCPKIKYLWCLLPVLLNDKLVKCENTLIVILSDVFIWCSYVIKDKRNDWNNNKNATVVSIRKAQRNALILPWMMKSCRNTNTGQFNDLFSLIIQLGCS